MLTTLVTLYSTSHTKDVDSNRNPNDDIISEPSYEPIIQPILPNATSSYHLIPFIISMIAFILSLLGASLPYFLARTDTLSYTHIVIFTLVHTFIAGIMVTSGILILLPQALSILSPQVTLSFFLLGLFVYVIWEHICIGLYACIAPYCGKISRYDSVYEDVSSSTEDEFPRSRRSQRTRPTEHHPILGISIPTYGTSASHYGHASELSPTNVVTSSTISSTSVSSISSNIRETVNAAEYVAGSRYIARCVMCKDTIKNSKGLAYHASGCQTKTLPYLSSIDRSLHGFHGSRHEKRVIIDTYDAPILLWCILIPMACLIGQACWNQDMIQVWQHDFSVSFILHTLIQLVALLSFHYFTSFTLGLSLKQGHLNKSTIISLIILYALLWPLGVGIHIAASTYLSPAMYHIYVGIIHSIVGGILVYISCIEILLEEFERRDARTRKFISLLMGVGIVMAIIFVC